jgi:hypothetical protein
MFGATHFFLTIVYAGLLVLAIFRYKKFSSQIKTLAFFGAMIVFCEGLFIVLSYLGKASFVYMKYQVLIIMSTFFYILWKSSLNAPQRKILKWIIVQFLGFAVLSFILPQARNEWPTYLFLSMLVSFILGALLGLLSLLNTVNPVPILKQSMFWFYASHFCFYCYSFVLFTLRSIETVLSGLTLHIDLILYGNIFFYLIFTYALWIENNRYFAPQHVD